MAGAIAERDRGSELGAAALALSSRCPTLRLTGLSKPSVAGLLGARTFFDEYDHLFGVRSAFLHGRAMGAIFTTERVLARKLARQVVAALVDHAVASSFIS